MTETQLGRFMQRLRRTRKLKGKGLSSIMGGKNIAKAIEEIERIDNTLNRPMPPPDKLGSGTTGEATLRMSRGGPRGTTSS